MGKMMSESDFIWGEGERENIEAITAREDTRGLFSRNSRCNRRILGFKNEFPCLFSSQAGGRKRGGWPRAAAVPRMPRGTGAGDLSSPLDHELVAAGVEHPQAPVSAGTAAAPSPLDLLCCLISLKERHNDRLWPPLFLKHFLLPVSSFPVMEEEPVTVPCPLPAPSPSGAGAAALKPTLQRSFFFWDGNLRRCFGNCLSASRRLNGTPISRRLSCLWIVMFVREGFMYFFRCFSFPSVI